MARPTFSGLYKQYLTGLILLNVTLLVLLVGTNHYMLGKSGEYLTPAQIYAVQSDETAVNMYGSAVANRSTDIKIYAYAQKKPDIALIGSSRVLQFRQSFFTRSSYNLGLMVGSVDGLDFVIDSLLALHTPKIMIIGVDFWWFNTADETKKPVQSLGLSPEYNLTGKLKNATLPVRWLQDGSVTASEYAALLFSSNSQNIGVRGKLRNDGVAPDGSYYYTDRVAGNHPDPMGGFQESFGRIERGESQFVHGEKASTILVDRFAQILERLKAKNIKVILLFPPMAPLVLQKMSGPHYAYVTDLKRMLDKKKISYYDFTDPATIGAAANCEFIDGFHGGDVLYARITERMAREDKSFAQYVDRPYVQKAQAYAGMAMIPDARITNAPETDFLKLGCAKAR